VGAAHLDDGYLTVGSGSVVVDLYFDALCPICGAVEKVNGDVIAALATSNRIELRLRPMTFLDRASQGTEYSTRAAAALTCVAASTPDRTLDYFRSLYEHQPQEGSRGLDDDALAALAEGTGPDVADCIAEGRYRSWAQWVNDRALEGPIAGADIPAVKGTPTLLRDGKVYAGSPLDGDAVEGFLAGE